MADENNAPRSQALSRLHSPKALRAGLLCGVGLFGISLLAAFFLPRSFALAAFGDALQFGLIAAGAIFAFQNFLHSRSRARIFWFLVFTGFSLWTLSTGIWMVYEVWLARPVPDVAVVDILLFLKFVPLTVAFVLAPDREQGEHFRAFGLLDVFVLMIYSLYLFTIAVFAYRLLPGAETTYNFNFNLAAAISNQVLVVVAGISVLRAKSCWRGIYRLYFFAAVGYAFASNLSNIAIDTGKYYTGSLYDVPLVGSLIAFICVPLAGRTAEPEEPESAPNSSDAPSNSPTFLSEHLAMLVSLSTPTIGIWLLSSATAPVQLRQFRTVVTLVTTFLLTLLLSIKQDILAAGLFESLLGLSDTYGRIERFKSHLTQSEKLASLGGLVAQVAKQIKGCMAVILEASKRLTRRPEEDARIQNMAAKIEQYGQRTNALVDNMLHFAQETPLRLEPVDVKPLLESALHLSRIAKLAQIRVDITQEGDCPKVRGDSSQLLLVFLQLLANAVDALTETKGGRLDIALRPDGARLLLEFADSGPGIKEPQRVFEPFYTTKPVGKGTGLGLSTCYGIIQQHDGEISCRNRPEGGALFSVSLPAVLPAVPESCRAADTLLVEGVR